MKARDQVLNGCTNMIALMAFSIAAACEKLKSAGAECVVLCAQAAVNFALLT